MLHTLHIPLVPTQLPRAKLREPLFVPCCGCGRCTMLNVLYIKHDSRTVAKSLHLVQTEWPTRPTSTMWDVHININYTIHATSHHSLLIGSSQLPRRALRTRTGGCKVDCLPQVPNATVNGKGATSGHRPWHTHAATRHIHHRIARANICPAEHDAMKKAGPAQRNHAF